jgi:hypothetical protein
MFQEQLAPEWQQKMKIMIPSYGQTLNDKPELLSQRLENNTATVLKLNKYFQMRSHSFYWDSLLSLACSYFQNIFR